MNQELYFTTGKKSQKFVLKRLTVLSLFLMMLVLAACEGKGYLGEDPIIDDPIVDDPIIVNNNWISLPNYQGTHVSNAVSFSIEGKLYVGMGSNSTTGYKNDLWQYDPVAKIWTEKAEFPGEQSRTCFVLNGKAYIVSVNCEMWQYNPVTNVWMQKTSFEESIEQDFSFACNGKGYVNGGYNKFYEYDPIADTWSKLADFNRSGLATSSNQNGYLIESNSAFWIYTPETDRWVQRMDFANISPKYSFTIDNSVYAGVFNSPYSDNWDILKYNADANTWSVIAKPYNLSLNNRDGALTLVCDKKLYFGLGTGYIDFWEYDLSKILE
ncbi:hypothetical protein LJC11_00850 [Bacteroidales bacterium OttesenSCG-928-I21]|nr:hypothetical protein [Bacteroidales bacterium OttesenSCG-928-I21]